MHKSQALQCAFYNVELPKGCTAKVQQLRDLIGPGLVKTLVLMNLNSPGLFRMLLATLDGLGGPQELCATCSAFIHARMIDVHRGMWMELFRVETDSWPPAP